MKVSHAERSNVQMYVIYEQHVHLNLCLCRRPRTIKVWYDDKYLKKTQIEPISVYIRV